MRFGPPNRVWIKHEDGKWTSREWNHGEKQEYAAQVGIQLDEPVISNDFIANILRKDAPK